ncbi:MAG: NFACT RNA binding domain-containing protein [Candidatus Norongarragalinales archaeon]
MKIRLDIRKTVWQNAADYFERAKRARAKAEGARRAIAQTEASLAKLRAENEFEQARAVAEAEAAKTRFKVKTIREREWFEKYRWFRTSGGFLVVAGKDARQNEDLVARHFEASDLFFHADVHGAPATILKDGTKASQQDKLEAAQWAAAYSSAWKSGAGACDAYAARKEQVSKYSHGEFVAKGAFVIRGTREWFKNAELALLIAKNDEERVIAAPAVHAAASKNAVRVKPGGVKKSEAAKRIAARLGCDASDVEKLLPGDCEIV